MAPQTNMPTWGYIQYGQSWNFSTVMEQSYCLCDHLQQISLNEWCENLENIQKMFDTNYHPNWVVTPKTFSNSSTKSSSLKFEAKGAFKVFSKEKKASESCRKTQWDTPSIRKKKIFNWEKVDSRLKINQENDSNLDFFKIPKMFNDISPTFSPEIQNEGRLVGFYTQKERRNKINHLRRKLQKHKMWCPVNKQYKGRSQAARSKVRLWGKFVKAELAEKYAVDEKVFHERNVLIDKYVAEEDYQKAVEVLAEY